MTAIRYALVVAVIASVAVTLWHLDRGAVSRLVTPRAVPYLALAVAANIVATGFGLLAWRVLLADSRPRLQLRTSCRIFAASLLTKYLPGRLWALVTHVEMGRDAGVSGARMASAFLLSLSVTMLAGGAVATTGAPARLGGGALWLAVPVAVLAVVAVRPALIGRAYAFAALLLRRPRPTTAVSARGLRVSIAGSVAYWVFSGLHLWVLATMFGAAALPALPVCVGGFALASLVGGFAFFLPDGWGAREVTMAALLSTVLPWTAATAVAVASRVVCVLTELGISVVTLLATAESGRRPPLPAPSTQPEGSRACPTATT